MINIRNEFILFYDFYIVAKEMSFSKTAEKYLLSQANLSRNIQELEKILNLTLFIRNKKGIEKLTSDGENLFQTLEKIFGEIERYSNNYLNDSNVLNGKIVIGTTRNISDIKLPIYLDKFYKKYPNVEIQVITDSARNLHEYLITHKIDVLIDYLPQIEFGEKYNINVIPIGNFETCFACSKKYYKEIKNDIKRLIDLNNYKLVIPGESRRKQILDSMLQSLNIKLDSTIRMPDSKGMAEFIKRNDCIGYFIKEEAKAYDLEILSLEENLPNNEIGIIFSNNSVNNIAKKFIELVLEQ